VKSRRGDLTQKIEELVKEHWADLHPRAEFKAGESYIPYAGRVFDHREVMAVIESGLDFWLTAGEQVEEFERRLAGYIGVGHCLTVNSGSSANLLAFYTLTSSKLEDRRIKRGDEVITTAACFPTTVAPIVQAGALPVFVDVQERTYNATLESVEKAISRKTKAVILAHTLGNPFPVRDIRRLCDEHQLWLIEDNCDALGSIHHGEKTGSFGHLSTCSFYPAHHITTGEGGAVLTDDQHLARIAASVRDWGRDCWCPSGKDDTCKKRFEWQLGQLPQGYDHKYIYSHLGFNLKMTEMQAAIGVRQMERVDGFIEKRKENFHFFSDALKDQSDFLILPEATRDSDPSWFGFPVMARPEAGVDRDRIIQWLESGGIATRLLFAGNIVRQPAFEGVEHRVSGDLYVTDRITSDLFWIGVYPGIGQPEREYIAERLAAFFKDQPMGK
jgi:CDP-6-deoxy-D-xylo-4-hexulose-3-dehydrase